MLMAKCSKKRGEEEFFAKDPPSPACVPDKNFPLLAQAELLDQCAVTLNVGFLEIVQ